MAYTYDDFLKVANKSNLLKQFGTKDLEITKNNPEYGLSMLRLMQDRAGAVSPEARMLAGEAMNLLRRNYNVQETATGGVSDPEMDLKDDTVQAPAAGDQTEAPTQFQYGREDEYQALLDQITNPPDFQYDPQQDPSWSAFRKTYLREGERAAQDALTRASAATGGVPSSYAVTAAQQAGANYAEKLADALPALEQQAYERFLQNLGIKQDAFSAIQADRADAYGQWIDAYNMLLKYIELANQENTSSIPAEDLTQMQAAYPTGIISDKNAWDQLAALYGEEALTEAGFTFQSQGTESPINLSDFAQKVAANVAIGPLPGAIIGYEDPSWDETKAPTGVNQYTLYDLGYEGYPEEAIAKLVEAGMLEEYVVNGVVHWRLGPNNRTDSGEALYSPQEALIKAVVNGQ